MLGDRITRLRVQKGFSISELAEKANVSKSYLSYIERGIQKNPSLQFITKIAKTLETTVEELLGKRERDTDAAHVEIDQDWLDLIDEAVKQGIRKEDFPYYLDFVKFKNRNKD